MMTKQREEESLDPYDLVLQHLNLMSNNLDRIKERAEQILRDEEPRKEE